MENWEIYETNSKNYLNSILNNTDIVFEKTGGSDSTSNDILVKFKGKSLFSIEAKLSPSQCGQFVLVRDELNKLTLSENMRFSNKYTNQIIELIDTNYENEISLLNLDISQNLLSNWVKEHYIKKGVEFIITSTSLNSFNSIIPVNEIEKYFEFSGVLRRKRSGTRGVPKRDKNESKLLLEKHLKNLKINDYVIDESDGDVTFRLNEDSGIYNNLYFDKYFISKVNLNMYKVKVRATTNNLNVVFSLKYTGAREDFGIELLKDFIRTKIN